MTEPTTPELVAAIRCAYSAWAKLLTRFEAMDSDAAVAAHSDEIVACMVNIRDSEMLVGRWCAEYCARQITGNLHPMAGN